ncbi:MAG: diguanylate cyclase [Spirochaeta sp.]|nr:diguanylate cyclase [Spirochaeta sp.]
MLDTLLYVDGSDLFRRIVREAGRSSFRDVITVRNAAEAKQLIAERPVSLLVVTQQLEDGLGTELIEFVTSRYGIEIPCVLVTADEGIALREAALAAGAMDYLPKRLIRDGALETLAGGVRTDGRVLPLIRAARVLVLDDSRTYRAVIRQFLTLLGVTHATEFARAEELLAYFESHPPADDGSLEILLTDLVLPGTSGVSVIRAARAARPSAIIIAVSGLETPKAAGNALNAGADDFINKPFDLHLFNARLRRSVYPHVLLAELERKNEALQRMAHTDLLTGLANRGVILSTLGATLSTGGTVLLADIDRFKLINDTHGHLTGDRALRLVAAKLRRTVTEPGKVGRYGGEEFLIVLPGTDTAAATEIAEAIRAGVAALACVAVDSEERVTLTVSIGVAAIESTDTTPDDTILRADQCLYRAKEDGRNCVCTPTP